VQFIDFPFFYHYTPSITRKNLDYTYFYQAIIQLLKAVKIDRVFLKPKFSKQLKIESKCELIFKKGHYLKKIEIRCFENKNKNQ